MTAFADRLDGARLVITGEGSLDEQTLHGKAPVGVARATAAHDRAVPVIAVAGVSALSPAQLTAAGISAAYASPTSSRTSRRAGPIPADPGAAGRPDRRGLARLGCG